MPKNKYSEEERRQVIETLLSHARSFLNGETTAIETARLLARFHDVGPEIDPILVKFIAVDSETDALPIGGVRKYWNPAALAREDLKMEEAERLYRGTVDQACKRLVALLAPSIEPTG